MSGAQRGMAGYTLVELLVVLAIMALLAAASVPLISASEPGLRARTEARALADALIAARQSAIAHDAPVAVTFEPSARRYRIGAAVRTLPSQLSLAVQAPAADEIDFYADGSSSGGRVVIAAARARQVVSVRWPAGQVSLDE